MGTGSTFLTLKALLRPMRGRLSTICFWLTSSVWLGCLLANVSLGEVAAKIANTQLCNTKCYKHTQTCTHKHTLKPRPVLVSLDGNKVPIHPGCSPGSLAPAACDPAGSYTDSFPFHQEDGKLRLLLSRLSKWEKTLTRYHTRIIISSDR